MATFTSLKDGFVSQTLPQELINKIIDQFDPQKYSHRRTVLSCSQVCRGFSVCSQEFLFAETRLWYELSESGGSGVARLARCLKDSPHLGLYIKHFTLNMCQSLAHRRSFLERGPGNEHLFQIFKCLKRLRSLVITPTPAFDWSNSVGQILKSVFQTSLPSLIRIGLNGSVNFDPTIISNLHSLRSLKLRNVHFTFPTLEPTPSPSQSESLPLVRLEYLLSRTNSADFLDNCIFKPRPVIDVSGLRSLSIQEPAAELLEHISRLFYQCSRHLEFLDIGLGTATRESKHLDLSILSNLQTLQFRNSANINIFEYDFVSRAAQILQTLPSSNKLRTLTFNCDPDILLLRNRNCHIYDSETWEAIDSALVSMTLIHLRSITLVSSSWSYQLLGRSSYKVFPNTSALGIIVDFVAPTPCLPS